MSVMKAGLRGAVALLAAMTCASSMAAGVLKLSRVELTLEPGKPAGELNVENVGDAPLYLNVEQHWVANPGESPERLVPVTEVERPGLLIQPSRLVLAPGQKYQMVMKEFGTPPQTQVWRVTFRPTERIVVSNDMQDNRAAPLSISIGYGVVIYQRGDAG
ncbi:hypothetical protein IMT09_10070 [Burkholderia cepacia]|uniref:hypothetical protein n=1 Tax=Burkholderia cepacia TaxID=292 RepID=UPI0007598B81|nr:hypothetical protein [Burkholderia cepacia]KVF60565.1 hypothetical protein WJ15_22080 [Burkholderia cepacia]MBE2968442.1 hypothetical protein [Burkholderia cepacia]MCA8318820.1 hypothetical protein [Burkholderia cepacia]